MTMITLRYAKVLPLVAALAAACSKTPPEPTATSTPAAPATGQATAEAQAPAAPKPAPAAGQAGGELAWDAPASFESAPNPNAMRKATYKIKRAPGDAEDAELSVSRAGGSVEANITRWIGQFSEKSGEPKRHELNVGGIKVTVVEIRGTFSGSGMPGMPASAPKPSQAMLGAIAEVPSGESWFFKMTGPEKTVTAARGDFDKLLNSLRLK
ncbi:hypothetical protein SOCEGT47_041360 [Sorangium cellulosum]|jgi:hypothetical protein|uniref:Secreted protein n=1 Tax=Sorangium cellulosum TaxID=56 RepID=A0A4P2Q2W2_SORCE|nr:hypothetical protein [Sorangium cellulosum]AUX23609.1 hypothetical protein SOCEGT47_041360 [Sorangium cellulosum]